MTNHPARLTTEEILGEMFEMGNLQVCETGNPPTLEQSYAHVACLQLIKVVKWIDDRMWYKNYKKGDDLVVSNEHWESLLKEVSKLGG